MYLDTYENVKKEFDKIQELKTLEYMKEEIGKFYSKNEHLLKYTKKSETFTPAEEDILRKVDKEFNEKTVGNKSPDLMLCTKEFYDKFEQRLTENVTIYTVSKLKRMPMVADFGRINYKGMSVVPWLNDNNLDFICVNTMAPAENITQALNK